MHAIRVIEPFAFLTHLAMIEGLLRNTHGAGFSTARCIAMDERLSIFEVDKHI